MRQRGAIERPQYKAEHQPGAWERQQRRSWERT
jgi:hypothetical protein